MNSKSRLFLVLVIVVIIIGAIWWSVSQKNSTQTNSFTFVCPAEEKISAVFTETGDAVDVVLPDGRELKLTQVISASGARYANSDESIVFWNKGNEVFVQENGVTIYDQCIEESQIEAVTNNKKDVEAVVTSFGKKLQNVSLAAENASTTIASEYAPFVTPELLSSWINDPTKAPGREVSSPWPDHITIKSIEKGGVVYAVTGEVVYMTSEEVTNGRNAGTEEVVIMVSERDGKWLISDFMSLGKDTGATSTSTESVSTSTVTE